MSDTISRQAAIDAVKTYWKKVVDDIPKGVGFEELTQLCNMALEHNANILKAIDQLPSAQPEQPPYVAEIEAEYQKAVKMPHIHKPLAKALYEVWKKHDREDAERKTDG